MNGNPETKHPPSQLKRSYFDLIAAQWDSFGNTEKRRESLRSILGSLRIDATETILDIGCGTGNLTASVLDWLSGRGRIVAVDFSEEMITVGKLKVPDERVSWWVCDAAALPIVPSCIDRAICYSSWPHFEDAGRVASGILRALKPGGWLHIIHTESREHINTIHANAGGPIAHDVLPPAKEVETTLTDLGFLVKQVIDNDEMYFLSAMKPG